MEEYAEGYAQRGEPSKKANKRGSRPKGREPPVRMPGLEDPRLQEEQPGQRRGDTRQPEGHTRKDEYSEDSEPDHGPLPTFKAWRETTRKHIDELAKAASAGIRSSGNRGATEAANAEQAAINASYDEKVRNLLAMVVYLKGEKERAEEWLEMTENKLAKERASALGAGRGTQQLEQQLEAIEKKLAHERSVSRDKLCEAKEKVRKAEQNARAAKEEAEDAAKIAAAAAEAADAATAKADAATTRAEAAVHRARKAEKATIAAKTSELDARRERMLANRSLEMARRAGNGRLEGATRDLEELRRCRADDEQRMTEYESQIFWMWKESEM
jgi:DNA repair exonuclease SbcCD ATPase subunit